MLSLLTSMSTPGDNVGDFLANRSNTSRKSAFLFSFFFSGNLTCPIGFTQMDSFCYHYRLEDATFDQHKNYCIDKGGYMVNIGTEVENFYVAEALLGNENFYLSGLVIVVECPGCWEP